MDRSDMLEIGLHFKAVRTAAGIALVVGLLFFPTHTMNVVLRLGYESSAKVSNAMVSLTHQTCAVVSDSLFALPSLACEPVEAGEK